MSEDDSLHEFPCDFDIKVMGAAGAGLEQVVAHIVRRHVGAVDAMRTRESRKGNYVAVTVSIVARDKRQLDAIYSELSAHEKVLMAL